MTILHKKSNKIYGKNMDFMTFIKERGWYKKIAKSITNEGFEIVRV